MGIKNKDDWGATEIEEVKGSARMDEVRLTAADNGELMLFKFNWTQNLSWFALRRWLRDDKYSACVIEDGNALVELEARGVHLS